MLLSTSASLSCRFLVATPGEPQRCVQSKRDDRVIAGIGLFDVVRRTKNMIRSTASQLGDLGSAAGGEEPPEGIALLVAAVADQLVDFIEHDYAAIHLHHRSKMKISVGLGPASPPH